MFPQLPGWDGLHPLIIHFPIALLLVAPILVLLGLLFPSKGRTFLVSAFILMLLGTIASFIAVSTGEAAGELADRAAGVASVMEEHEELAETTRTVFTVLTSIFGVIVFAPMLFKKDLKQMILVVVNLAFLLFYGSGLVLLVNTAHQGGRLVHEFGVRAMVATTAQTDGAAPSRRASKHDDDD